MYTNSLLAVSGALLAAAAAVPMAETHHHHHHLHPLKRDYVWVTYSEVFIETVAVTKTVWVEPGETPNVQPPVYSAPAQTTPAVYSPPPPPPPAPAQPSPPEDKPSSSPSPTPSPPAPPVYVAPAPSPSQYVPPPPPPPPPAPTTPASVAPAAPTYVPPPPPPAPPAPPAPAAPAGGSSGSNGLSSGMGASGKTYTGDLTWYDVGLGACGETSTKDEAVVAIPEAIFDSYSTGNPNTNPLCGKYVSITGKDGQQYKARIVDRCPGCTQNDLDLSQDFFNKVTQNGDGRVHGMQWCFD